MFVDLTIHRFSPNRPAGQSHCKKNDRHLSELDHLVDSFIAGGSLRKVPPTNRIPPGTAQDDDILRTILRDLHGIRMNLLRAKPARDTLERVDVLIDNIENYMAEN